MFRTEESLLNLWKPRHCPECVSVRNVCHGRLTSCLSSHQAHGQSLGPWTDAFLAFLWKSSFLSTTRPQELKKENGSKPVPGCPGINPTAVASLAEDRITTTSVRSKKKRPLHWTCESWTNFPLSWNAVALPRNPKQQPTYTSRRRRFCRNILTVCFLSKQNTFMATKIKSRDTLLPLDDFRSHSKHTRSAAQFLKRAQSTHVTFRESVLARVSLGIARLCGDTITLPSGMNTVACVPAHPGIKPSLPRTSLSFSWPSPSLFSPFNSKTKEQQQRRWFPSRPPRRRRRSQANLHQNLHPTYTLALYPTHGKPLRRSLGWGEAHSPRIRRLDDMDSWASYDLLNKVAFHGTASVLSSHQQMSENDTFLPLD